MNQPKQISTPWAEEGLKNNIPSRRDVGLSQESATYQEGFPSITMTPISVGGKPPSGRDMNGVLYELSANIAFMNKGKHYKFNQDFCNEINGYPKGAVLINDKETALYISTVDQNKTNFNTQNSESWKVVADIKFSESLEKKADKHSPAFTGTPIAPTPEQSVNSEQIATTAFVKAAIAALVGSAPETLDTLAEIATALGNDSNLKQVLLAEIGNKANKSEFTSFLDLFIGVPIALPTATLPVINIPGYTVTALDGGRFSTSLYPKLAKVYPSGVKPDARGEFIRGADMGRNVDTGRQLLSSQGDAIRNITGMAHRVVFSPYLLTDAGFTASGAIYDTGIPGSQTNIQTSYNVGATSTRGISFDASRVVPTANENRPRNIAYQYVCLAA